jgi:hypothetical protein
MNNEIDATDNVQNFISVENTNDAKSDEENMEKEV